MDEYFRSTANIADIVEWAAVFSFLAISFIYFLAPVLGYPAEQRGLILISLYLLVAYGVLVLAQLLMTYFLYLTGAAARANFNFAFIFGILKLLVFLASQGVFVFGLQGMRRSSANHP